ncbi:hypothetical protein [Parapedobacter sp. DT-150]|uniref:hypothetical protein n=1 Tax=Parapedobacter sp. DT-150 TaxID=3396162 RepID=UPI003F196B91
MHAAGKKGVPQKLFIMILLQKSVKVVKDYFFTLALVVTFIGFSAFKVVQSTQAPEDGWYNVSITGSPASDPGNQQIGMKLTTDPPTSGLGCAQQNTGDRCAIHLAFDATATEVPNTVEEAEDSSEVTVGDDASDRP